VCSKWRGDLYVEVLRDRKSPFSPFLSLRGRCGLCFKKAVFGFLYPDAGTDTATFAEPLSVQRGAPRWCSTHRSAQQVALLPATCTHIDASGHACTRRARMCSGEQIATWRSMLAAQRSEEKDSVTCAEVASRGSSGLEGAEASTLLPGERRDEDGEEEKAEATFPRAVVCERHSTATGQGLMPMVSYCACAEILGRERAESSMLCVRCSRSGLGEERVQEKQTLHRMPSHARCARLTQPNHTPCAFIPCAGECGPALED
jgi:hypothetical protein